MVALTYLEEEIMMSDAQADTMKAIVHVRYGLPEGLELREVERPDVPDDSVLIRVRAATINPADWYGVVGRPWVARPMMGLRGPKSDGVGADLSGTVVSVGKSVTRFKPGDDVFGRGRLGELASVAEGHLALKPDTVSFEQAAAVPVAGLTALQGLRDKAEVEPGQRVLINGASGGVGTFAVQIAKALGTEVTAVCSTRNVELVRSLGADHVIDYTRDDFTRGDRRYDVLLDIAGSRSWRACKRVLERRATFVVIGGPKKPRFLGPMRHIAGIKLASFGSSRKDVWFIAKIASDDLDHLAELVASGKVTPVLDRRFALTETAAAFSYLGEGHAQGKILIEL